MRQHFDTMPAVEDDLDDEPCPLPYIPPTNSKFSVPMPERDDQSSNCYNCPDSTDGHTLDTCDMECFDPDCHNTSLHFARYCPSWKFLKYANTVRMIYPGINDQFVQMVVDGLWGNDLVLSADVGD